jgi:predicted component of type VI protein secretion system
MYTLSDVISALEKFCSDEGETIEERENRLGAASAPIRVGLIRAGDPVINRNIKLALSQLNIDVEEFFRHLQTGSR